MTQPESLPDQSERLRWLTISGPMAWCAECAPTGGFAYHGDQDRGARRAIAKARAHADATGHEVIVERGQSLRVKPAASRTPDESQRGMEGS